MAASVVRSTDLADKPFQRLFPPVAKSQLASSSIPYRNARILGQHTTHVFFRNGNNRGSGIFWTYSDGGYESQPHSQSRLLSILLTPSARRAIRDDDAMILLIR